MFSPDKDAQPGPAGSLSLSDPDRDLQRLLSALEGEDRPAVTVPELRELGVRAPGQAIYMLQLHGYQIERVAVPQTDAGELPGYRMCRSGEGEGEASSVDAHPHGGGAKVGRAPVTSGR